MVPDALIVIDAEHDIKWSAELGCSMLFLFKIFKVWSFPFLLSHPLTPFIYFSNCTLMDKLRSCVHSSCSNLKTNVAKLEWTERSYLTLAGLFAPVRQPKYLPVIVDDTPGFSGLNGFDGEARLCSKHRDGIAKLRAVNWTVSLGHHRLNSVSYNTTTLICKRPQQDRGVAGNCNRKQCVNCPTLTLARSLQWKCGLCESASWKQSKVSRIHNPRRNKY